MGFDCGHFALTAESCWRVVGATSKGLAHERAGQNCQDAVYAEIVEDSLIAFVADGAGSAARAEHGARCSVRAAVKHARDMLPELPLLDTAANPEQCHRWAVELIQRTRGDLATLASEFHRQHDSQLVGEVEDTSTALRDYDSTLVGVIATTAGGMFIHIGDGAAAAYGDIGTVVTLSQPRNGETSDTTFFVTESHWQEQLRVTLFSASQRFLVLMTDGVTPFALAPGGAGLFGPFITPVTRFLSANSNETGALRLFETINSEQTSTITADDKTILWAQKL
jgi:hypothetical protein